MYNIIIENDIPTLYRADSRSPQEIIIAGGFTMSRSLDTDGTLGEYENGRAVEPIVYTAETYGGMREFLDGFPGHNKQMPGDRYFYEINSLGMSVARYTENIDRSRLSINNLTQHLMKQKALLDKNLVHDWEGKSVAQVKALLSTDHPGELAWYSVVSRVRECHIIGSVEQLIAPQLYGALNTLAVIVPLSKITSIGRRSNGGLTKVRRDKIAIPLG